jgi:hypothetical protein
MRFDKKESQCRENIRSTSHRGAHMRPTTAQGQSRRIWGPIKGIGHFGIVFVVGHFGVPKWPIPKWPIPFIGWPEVTRRLFWGGNLAVRSFDVLFGGSYRLTRQFHNGIPYRLCGGRWRCGGGRWMERVQWRWRRGFVGCNRLLGLDVVE